MPGDHLAEKYFMFELDAGHIEQVVETFLHSELFRKNGSLFVLDGVLAFETAGKIHRHKPTGNMTGQPEHTAYRPEDLFANWSWRCVELFQPYAYTPAMVPFLSLDIFYALLFGRFTQTPPMAAICIGGGYLTGIGVLQNADEIFAGGAQVIRIVTELELDNQPTK